jgi:hypothetical protein
LQSGFTVVQGIAPITKTKMRCEYSLASDVESTNKLV